MGQLRIALNIRGAPARLIERPIRLPGTRVCGTDGGKLLISMMRWPLFSVIRRRWFTAGQWLFAGAALLALASSSAAQTRPETRPDQFFAHPEALCGALEGEGIHTSAWAPIGRGPHPANTPFDCESSGVNTIFRVSGNNAWRADIISVAVTVANPSDWPAAQKEFVRLVTAIFKFIGKPVPPGLLRAINTRRQYLLRWPYGVVWFNFVTPSELFPGQRTFWFRLSE